MFKNKTKVGRFNVPTWALIVLNILAPIVGILLGSGAIEVLIAEPESGSRIGAIRPGQEKSTMIDWPMGNFTGGQLSMILDVGVNTTIANDVVVTVEIVDPEDKARSYTVAKLDTFAIKRSDGLMYSSNAVDLIPILKNMRGIVRDFKVRKVPIRARVERKDKTSTSQGLVFVTSANVIGKALLAPL